MARPPRVGGGGRVKAGPERKKQADPSRFVQGLPMGSELLCSIFLPEKTARKVQKILLFTLPAVLLTFGDR